MENNQSGPTGPTGPNCSTVASCDNKSIPIIYFLHYEIYNSWWCQFIGWDLGSELAGRYFAWKVKRKYKKYVYVDAIHKKLMR